MDEMCVFILSHERPERVRTIRSLEKAGYTGEWRVVVDRDDGNLAEYKARFEDKLFVFDKASVADEIDLADNFPGRQTPLFAREKVWEWAEEMGLDYFMVMDDDYYYIEYKVDPDGSPAPEGKWAKNLDQVIEEMRAYMEGAPIDCLAFSQGGDWIGGTPSGSDTGFSTRRKVMNAYLFRTDRRFDFKGRFNDDVNTYVQHGNLGRVLLTFMPVKLDQEDTQDQGGGITEAYEKYGTYVKSFYTVMHAPSCTTINGMGQNHRRWHHRISWRNALPKIVPEKYRKSE
jgi:hypothetical protein